MRPRSSARGEDCPAFHYVDLLTDTVGVGEWCFSALVEVDGKRVLFDSGGRAETVLNNARELGVDLSNVEDVILSHNHWDHVSGLVTLRRELSKTNPKAFSRAQRLSACSTNSGFQKSSFLPCFE
jgi:metal-dependent hydrolase (beta-lactamase superfamily II)